MDDWERVIAFLRLVWFGKRTTMVKPRVFVSCDEATHKAAGVAAELAIAREEKRPYFLLYGRSDKTCTKPTTALESDKMYKWTWDNLKTLIAGGRGKSQW